MKDEMMIFCLFFMALIGIFSFVSNKLHLLNSLLSLEFLGVCVYWMFSVKFSLMGGEVYYGLFYLVMVVCEGVLGLSLLVCMCWGYGSDYMKIASVSLC